MKLRAYTIYDNKALIYHPPFYSSTDAQGMRHLSDLANDQQTSIGRHPADYSLYFVGEWDDQSAAFTPITAVHVSNAIDHVYKPTPLPLDERAASEVVTKLVRKEA